MIPITTKNVVNSRSGSRRCMEERDTIGKTRSITATAVAQSMSIKNGLQCGPK